MHLNKCFVCTGEIQNGTSESDNSSSEENSILLCKILELPDGNETKIIGGRKISYCRLCLNKILNICDMLEELERLEKKVLDEKYSIELQLKDKEKSQGQNSSEDQLRGQIVTDLRAASIGSMLDKIRKKRVGQRHNAKGPRNIRIVKSVTIPKILSGTIQPISEAEYMMFVLQESQSELVHDEDSCLPSPQSFVSNDHSEVHVEDTTREDPLTDTDNSTETSCTSVNEECDIKYEMRSDAVMAIDPLQLEPEYFDFSQHNDLNGHISTKLEIDELPDVTKFSDAQRTSTTEDSPSHKKFICGTCEAEFVSYIQLRIHDRIHLNGVNGRSTVKTIRRSIGKFRHKNLTPSVRPKKCEECGKVLSSNQNWTNHVMGFHRGQYKFKCALCNFGCQKRAHLERHKHVHEINSEESKCSSCDRVFKSKRSLSQHMRHHSLPESLTFSGTGDNI